MKRRYCDVVDAEPLEIRFPLEGEANRHADSLAEYLADRDGKLKQLVQYPDDIRYWDVEIEKHGVVLLRCEGLMDSDIDRILVQIANRFPMLTEAVFGVDDPDMPTSIDTEWLNVPDIEFTYNKKLIRQPAFQFSRHCVSIGAFRKFVSETNYQPSSDVAEGWKCFFEWQEKHYRDEHKQQLAPVGYTSFQDAMAFSDWARVRIPNDVEWLAGRYFQLRIKKPPSSWYSSWTTETTDDGMYVLRRAPCHLEDFDAAQPHYVENWSSDALRYGEPWMGFHVCRDKQN